MNISIVIDKIDHILDSLKKKILFSVSLLTLYGIIVLFLLTGELMAIQIISFAKVFVQWPSLWVPSKFSISSEQLRILMFVIELAGLITFRFRESSTMIFFTGPGCVSHEP